MQINKVPMINKLCTRCREERTSFWGWEILGKAAQRWRHVRRLLKNKDGFEGVSQRKDKGRRTISRRRKSILKGIVLWNSLVCACNWGFLGIACFIAGKRQREKQFWLVWRNSQKRGPNSQRSQCHIPESGLSPLCMWCQWRGLGGEWKGQSCVLA